MDFDDLKRVWDDCDRKLAAGIHLNARRVRSMMALQDETENRLVADDIDYTMPVAVVQEQLDAPRIVTLVRRAAAVIGGASRADRLTGKFRSTLMRLLGRHRTLRS
jgi:hypothetical protein